MDLQNQIREDGTVFTLVHFLFRSPRGVIRREGLDLGQGAASEDTWKIACVPNLLEMHALATRPHPWQRTDDPRAVTCPSCQNSEPYRQALAALDAAGIRRTR